jgi:hypothetical protein
VTLDADLPTGWRRPFVRFWLRNGWRGVAWVTAPILVIAVILVWSATRQSTSAGRQGALQGGYSFAIPAGWDVANRCHDSPIDTYDLPDRGTYWYENNDEVCLRPDRYHDPGVYLLSLLVDEGEPLDQRIFDLSNSLGGAVPGYTPCGRQVTGQESTEPSVELCMKHSDEVHGTLRVRLYLTRAVVEMCQEIDVPAVRDACDRTWRSIQVS